MSEASDNNGFRDWVEGPSFNDFDPSRRGDVRGIPFSYFAAAQRLPLCAAANDPASDTVSATPLPAAARDIPPAAPIHDWTAHVIEVDEIDTYIQRRQRAVIWMAYSRWHRRVVAYHLGDYGVINTTAI